MKIVRNSKKIIIHNESNMKCVYECKFKNYIVVSSLQYDFELSKEIYEIFNTKINEKDTSVCGPRIYKETARVLLTEKEVAELYADPVLFWECYISNP